MGGIISSLFEYIFPEREELRFRRGFDDPPEVVTHRPREDREIVPSPPAQGYTVTDVFLKKHVATWSEMPRSNRKVFADEKAKRSYDVLPSKYSIIVVDDKEEFREAISAEANREANGREPFTTDEDFDVVNFHLNDSNHYNFDEEGRARLVLRACNDYNEICHLEDVEFL